MEHVYQMINNVPNQTHARIKSSWAKRTTNFKKWHKTGVLEMWAIQRVGACDATQNQCEKESMSWKLVEEKIEKMEQWKIKLLWEM